MKDKRDETALAPDIVGRGKYRGLLKHHGSGAYRAWISRSFSLVLPLSVCLLKSTGKAGIYMYFRVSPCVADKFKL
jgi:hypothetical protein